MNEKKHQEEAFDAGIRACVEMIDNLLVTYWKGDGTLNNRVVLAKGSLELLLQPNSPHRSCQLKKLRQQSTQNPTD